MCKRLYIKYNPVKESLHPASATHFASVYAEAITVKSKIGKIKKRSVEVYTKTDQTWQKNTKQRWKSQFTG